MKEIGFKRIDFKKKAYVLVILDLESQHMSQKQLLQERNKFMNNQKIILQLTRLLEQQNLISSSGRMKMTDLIRKGH